MIIRRKLVAMKGTASWSSPTIPGTGCSGQDMSSSRTLKCQCFLGLGEDLASEQPRATRSAVTVSGRH